MQLTLTRVASTEVDAVVEGVFHGIKRNRSLRKLRVSVPEGAPTLSAALHERLVEALQENGVLFSIEGLKLPVGDPLTTRARWLLKQNTFGRHFLLHPRGPPPGILVPILSKISRAGARDAMFQFLRSNASFAPRGVTRVRSGSNE
jgi:hypothetical protein